MKQIFEGLIKLLGKVTVNFAATLALLAIAVFTIMLLFSIFILGRDFVYGNGILRCRAVEKSPGFLDLPIGTIVAWNKSALKIPSFADGWVECNGQTLEDEQSVFNKTLIPNLNGEGRFLRGGKMSGTFQPATTLMNGGEDVVRGVSDVLNADPAESPPGAKIANRLVGGSPNSVSLASEGRAMRPANMSVVWIMRVK
jgi:hypothetical protein